MSKIIRGYWDCKYCGTKKIDGLVDICENCGKQKSEDVKYYMGSPDDIVTEEELSAANISTEECDGEHPEWVCPYCQQLNDYADTVCIACGGNKEESTKNYDDFPIARTGVGMSYDVKRQLYGTSLDKNTQSASEDYFIDEFHERCKTIREESFENYNNSSNDDKIENAERLRNIEDKKLSKSIFFEKALDFCFASLPFIAAIFILFFCFFPFKHEAVISDFSWDRTVTVEEYKTVEESDWYLPTDARLLNTKTEYHSSRQVLDHYEARTRQASRTVQDGYDTYTTYEDNGNGTFRSVEHKTPKYKTEYYTETYQEPIYRTEPVYKTKYYYEIDKWVKVKDYATSGQNKDPYWSIEYSLEDNERDTLREEDYYIHYLDEDNSSFKDNVSYEEWIDSNIGDEKIVYRSLIGITY